MADNSYKINKSLNLNPQTGVPANPVNGDFFYDATAKSFAYYHDGAWAYIDSVSSVAASEPLTSAQFTGTIVRNALIRVTGGASPIHLDGMVASHSGKSIKLYNAGSDNIVVRHENASEGTANNRIHTPTAGSINLIPGEIATFTYDVVVNRWLVVSISSGTGALAIATTASPGIVTLHQASLFPLDGIVLSDGDLNTANGVVGLDANRAATIAAPTSAVTALTITAANNAKALVLNRGTGTEPAIRMTSSGTDCDISNQAGTLLLEWEASQVLSLTANAVPLWEVTDAGVIQAVGGNRKILNVADPEVAQAAASKNYVDNFRNYLINGGFDYWQRNFTSFTRSSVGRTKAADRWCIASVGTGGGTITLTRGTAFTGAESKYKATVDMQATGSGEKAYLLQEIDRDVIKQLRGKKVSAVFKWKNTGAANDAVKVSIISGTGAVTENVITGYTGSNTEVTSTLTPPGSQATQTVTTTSTLPTNITTLSLLFYLESSGPLTSSIFELADVQLVIADAAVAAGMPFRLAGQTQAGELALCQRFFEKSYEIDTDPATLTLVGRQFASLDDSSNLAQSVKFRITKWTVPTLTFYNAAAANSNWSHSGGTTGISLQNEGVVGFEAVASGSPDIVAAGDAYYGHWAADAEI